MDAACRALFLCQKILSNDKDSQTTINRNQLYIVKDVKRVVPAGTIFMAIINRWIAGSDTSW